MTPLESRMMAAVVQKLAIWRDDWGRDLLDVGGNPLGELDSILDDLAQVAALQCEGDAKLNLPPVFGIKYPSAVPLTALLRAPYFTDDAKRLKQIIDGCVRDFGEAPRVFEFHCIGERT